MGKYYDKRTLIEHLQKKAIELGCVPAPEDMTEPPAAAYLGFFKKWDKAVKAAGIRTLLSKPAAAPAKSSAESAAEPATESAPETITASVTAPTTESVTASATEPADVLEKADETPAAQGRRRYSKSIITQMLLDEFKRLGKKPTRKEIDANKNLPTVSTCLNYFGTTRIGDVWDEILKDL